MSSDDDRWMDWDAGPVARPYTVTGGRTRPRGETYFDLIDVVVATRTHSADSLSAGPERSQILDLCRQPITVADLASDIGLPLGVVRVLLADLLYEDLINATRQAKAQRVTDKRLLRQVLDGLHAL